MKAKRLKPWLAAGLFVVLVGVVFPFALKLAGVRLEISMGDTDPGPPHVFSGFPFDIDVTYRWAFVFSAPTDSSGDQFAAGTIVTNPIHWDAVPMK